MSAADDKRAIERLVAGLSTPMKDVAEAVTSTAIDRTIANDSLLRGLADEEAVVRMRSALRAQRMDGLAPAVEARLRVLATDDVDLRARRACAAALRAHGRPHPGVAASQAGESQVSVGQASAARRRRGAALWLRVLVPRSEQHLAEVTFVAQDRSAASRLYCRVVIADDGDVIMHVTGLPDAFVGEPLIVSVHGPDADEPVLTATTAVPVADDGSATVGLAASAAGLVGVQEWQTTEIKLASA